MPDRKDQGKARHPPQGEGFPKKGIKTRDKGKTIRTLDRSSDLSRRMKEAYIRTKGKLEQGRGKEETSPSEHATDHLSAGVDHASREVAHQVGHQGRKGVQTTKEYISKWKRMVQKRKATARQQKKRGEGQGLPRPASSPAGGNEVKTAKPDYQPTKAPQQGRPTTMRWENPQRVEKTFQPPGKAARRGREIPRAVRRSERNIKTVDRGRKAVKGGSFTAKGTVKTAGRPVRTAERTAKAGIKTSQRAAEVVQHSAQATMRAARAAAHAARTAATATARAVKAAAKASTSAVKAIIAATKALIAALAAGTGVAVLAVVVICLIGMLIGSAFGIFFSGEDSGSGQTIHTAIRAINQEYEDRLEALKSSSIYDTLEMSGARTVWKEVLAVYAVKTTTDADGVDVASVDEKKIRLLSEMFWEMNQIAASVEARTETVVDTATGEDGEMVDTEATVTQDVLVITVSHKTAWEMAELLHFDKNQREQLRELLSEEYDGLWNELLYGIAGGSGDLVAVALSQVGQVGGEPYWSWYGFGSRVEWCACFVSWCADQCGLLDSGAVPKFAGVGTGVQWFQSRGQWLDGSATPEPGMIIFFKWYGSDSLIADHVGIVERVEDGRIYTIEGNSDNMVRQNSYPIGYGEIKGYGAVAPGRA